MLQYSGVQGFKTVLQYSLLGSSVFQYTVLYCGWNGCRRPNCIAIQNCIVTRGAGVGAQGGRRWACG